MVRLGSSLRHSKVAPPTPVLIISRQIKRLCCCCLCPNDHVVHGNTTNTSNHYQKYTEGEGGGREGQSERRQSG